jgi:integrase
LTVKDAANAFLTAKLALVDAGELSKRSWSEYKLICDALIAHLGKSRLLSDIDTDDFAALRNKLSKRIGPVRLGNEIQRARSVFKYAFDAGLVEKPVRFGPGFKRPTKKVLRLHRAKMGPNLFSAEEIRRLLDAAGQPMKSMILLAINAGMGNTDVGRLPQSALDLEHGWLSFARPKTGIARRCSLWPETIVSLREALSRRPAPKDPADDGLFFVTKYGLPWAKDTSTSPVSQEFAKLLRALGINGRKGLGFYTLRHVFRTVADESKDQVAVDLIMGHARDDMASVYREHIADHRLRPVSDYVRRWLFGNVTPAEGIRHE